MAGGGRVVVSTSLVWVGAVAWVLPHHIVAEHLN